MSLLADKVALVTGAGMGINAVSPGTIRTPGVEKYFAGQLLSVDGGGAVR